jgi:hypothetical protein
MKYGRRERGAGRRLASRTLLLCSKMATGARLHRERQRREASERGQPDPNRTAPAYMKEL